MALQLKQSMIFQIEREKLVANLSLNEKAKCNEEENVLLLLIINNVSEKDVVRMRNLKLTCSQKMN